MTLLAIVGSALGLGVILYWVSHRLGRTQAQRDYFEKAAKNATEAQVIEDRVAVMDSSRVDAELQRYRRQRVPLGESHHPGPR